MICITSVSEVWPHTCLFCFSPVVFYQGIIVPAAFQTSWGCGWAGQPSVTQGHILSGVSSTAPSAALWKTQH